jgi:ribonuclease HII
MKIAGVDEAGKGPVIGPMVVCGVSTDNIEEIDSLGLKDSKKLSPQRRKQLADVIRQICRVEIVKVEPETLDKLMENKTINEILTDCYSEIIIRLNADITYVDCPDVIPERLKSNLEERTGKAVETAHKADEVYPIVSAASIVAKVERDGEVERLKRIFGDFGSGYASDERTIKFLNEYLRKYKKFPPFVRKSWKTLDRIQQQSLEEFW